MQPRPRRSLAPASLATTALGCTLSAACADVAPPTAGPELAIDIAALELEGVADAVWDIRVENEAGATVFATRVTSSRFGDGRGSATYIGTCDADANGDPLAIDHDPSGDPSAHWNKVFVTVRGLYTSGLTLDADHDAYGENDADFAPDAATAFASIDFRNPGTLSQLADCSENADTRVAFDVALMRPASQGFFDVAVTFNDIFCSAKFDCDAGALLFDRSGSRHATYVLGLACAAGSDAAPRLLMDDLVITCGGGAGPSVVTTVDPTAPNGNLCDTPGSVDGSLAPSGCDGLAEPSAGAGPLYQAAVYRAEETVGTSQLAYWNIALGVESGAIDLSTCTLATKATADDADAPVLVGTPARDVALGSVYPSITFAFSSAIDDGDPLTTSDAKSLAACGRNPLTFEAAPGQENVTITYSGTSDVAVTSFAHAFPPFPAAPGGADPFLGEVVLTLEKSVVADTAATSSDNIWGATFLGGVLYAHAFDGANTAIARYDATRDALVSVVATPASLGLANDGERFVVGSEEGCLAGPTCLRRYTASGELVDETPMTPVTGGLRGVTSRGGAVFMFGVIGACPDSIGVGAVDFGPPGPAGEPGAGVAAPHTCAGVSADMAVVATPSTIVTANGDGILSVYASGEDIPRTVALPAFSATEITALAYDPTTATLVVVSRARFTFYHVAAL